MTDLYIAKLWAGGFVIGVLNAADGILMDVAEIGFGQSPEGKIGLNMMPWMAPFDGSFKGHDIPLSSTAGKIPCPKEIEDMYIRKTTGLVMASQMPSGPLPGSEPGGSTVLPFKR